MAKTDITVRELVDKVQRQELALPEMQRRYVWPGTRVRDLLDSLYRGYPSGTILVWETDDDIETRELAVKATKTPTTSQKLLLLDGQQRVTSLAAILAGQPVHVRNRKKPIEILFNLEHPEGGPLEVVEVDEADTDQDIDEMEDDEATETDIQEELKQKAFVVASRALASNPIWVPVSEVFQKTDKEILKPIGITSDDERWDRYSARLQKIRKIAEYQYVMQLLDKKMSYEEVTEIFVRVNSLGIKLRGSDLALAQITSRWQGFMAEIENFAAEFKDDSDYVLESGLAVRALVVFATKQSRFKTVAKLSSVALRDAWKEAQNGLRFAINFVRSNAAVDNLRFLSSPFLLIPIAVYAVLHDEKLRHAEENGLLQWLYLAHMRAHYSGSAESVLDADLSTIFKKGDIDALVKQLVQSVKKTSVDSSDLANKGIRSPFFSMLYFVFRQNGARDWWSGLKLSDKHLGKTHAIQYHHIFPRSLLYNDKVEKREVNEIANMAFIGGKTNRQILNREPFDYLQKDVIPKRGEEALTSQLIPADTRLWKMASYAEFLAWRRNAIAEEINRFMGRLRPASG